MDLDIFNNFQKSIHELNIFENFLTMEWTEPLQNDAAVVRRRTDGRRRKRFNPLVDMDEHLFRLKYRFTKENMRKIIEMVRDDLELNPTEQCSKQVPVDLQIMAAIRSWGLTEHPEVTASVHGVSCRTLAKICKRIASDLATKASRYIRMPATLADKERVTNEFKALAGMQQVIGALAHASVRFRREMLETEETLDCNALIQVVSDACFKIRDLNCKLVACGNDFCASEMFAGTRIKERFEQNEFRGRILLASDHLPNTSFLFTPVMCPSSDAELAYNRSHEATLAPVNKCLDLWMRRFGVLGGELVASATVTKHTVIALALLHNMAIEWGDSACDTEDKTCSRGCIVQSASAYGDSADVSARTEFIRHNF